MEGNTRGSCPKRILLSLPFNKIYSSIGEPPPTPSLERRGGADSPLEGSVRPTGGRGVLPSVSFRNWDDRKITPPVFASGESTPLKGGGSELSWRSGPRLLRDRQALTRTQQINAGTSGDCATYHIEDVIKFPSNKRGGFETRQSREDGVCLNGDCLQR